MTLSTRIGLAITAALVAIAALAPWLAPHDPQGVELVASLGPPSFEHPLGLDRLGRDLLSRLLYGARISLWVGVCTVSISLAIGTSVGLVAGRAGGWVDEIAMRIVDVLLAFPGILLAIALAGLLGPSLMNVVLALSVAGWTGFARLVRAETLSLRERPHVEAAQALGLPEWRILTRHVLPLLAGPLAVQATFALAGAIVAEASLSFLGLGVPAPAPSWGAMLADGRSFLLIAPHVAAVPAAAIFVVVLGINFLGDGLRDHLARR